MIKCCQCEKQAIYSVDNEQIPLCLEHYLEYTKAMQMQQELCERNINFLSEQIEFGLGMPSMGPRFPERKQINVGGVKVHNINVSNSTVGVINSGNIESVDVAVSALSQRGDKDIASAIKTFADAIVASTDITNEKKNEAFELLSAISSEAILPKDRQRRSVIKTVTNSLETILSVSIAAKNLWNTWGPTITAWFSV